MTIPTVHCPNCNGINDTGICKFPHKLLIITTCKQPGCPLCEYTLGAGVVGNPEARATISEEPTIHLYGGKVNYDWRSGEKL